MTDPLIARFAEECGATTSLALRVESHGTVLAEGSVHQPFTLIGRDDACDVTLTDPDVNLRHAWLQVLGGKAFLLDLGSRTGLKWPKGQQLCGWLDAGVPVGIGPFQFVLRSPPSLHPRAWPAGFNPLRADAEVTRNYPSVALEFRNGRRPRDRWPVNRIITLIGRSPDCKIHLNAEDIALYHCGLVCTPAGLWVVDLSGRGVVVDGERMRIAPLRHSSELWVGRFLIGCIYPVAMPTPAWSAPSPLNITPVAPPRTFKPPADPLRPPSAAPQPTTNPAPTAPPQPTAIPGMGTSASGILSASAFLAARSASPAAGPGSASATPPPPEDEVPLGVAPPTDTSGLPSSHIMADALESLKQALAERNAAGGSTASPGSSGQMGPRSEVISLSGTMTPPMIELKPSPPSPSPRSSKTTPIAMPQIHREVSSSSPAPSPSARSGRSADTAIDHSPLPLGSPAAAEPPPPPTPTDPPPTPSLDAIASPWLVPLVKQLADVHTQMLDQFQHSLLLVVQMFQQLRKDQLAQLQADLLHIQELNLELAKMQMEMTRLTLTRSAEAVHGSAAAPGPPLPAAAHNSSASPPAYPASLVAERIQALQRERQLRWQQLVGALTPPPVARSG